MVVYPHADSCQKIRLYRWAKFTSRIEEGVITLDFRKFRIYLRERLDVIEAYYSIGYIQENQALYANLQRSGFILQFKEVSKDGSGKTKGNVDVDLTLRVMFP
jgi:hypothetical protein